MREKLIELLYKAEEQADKRCDFAENCDKCPADNHPGIDCLDWLKADCLIANGVTVQKWIPVTERLPEDLPENKGKKVINCIVAHTPYSNGKLTSQFRQRKWDKWDDKWYWSKIGGCTVTHWMPLPEPPKEKDNETTN